MTKNTLLLLALATTLVTMGAGCSPATPSSSNSPSVPSATAPVATTHYINADLGLGFDYPTAWGAPKIDEESGQQNGKYNGCIYQRAVEFPELKGSGILLTTMSTKTCQAPGREGYWGDQASGLTAQGWTSKADCDSGSADVCDLFKTTSGESVWHRHYPKYEIAFSGEGDTVSINKYVLYHTGHPLSGVMISDERLPENVDAQSVGDLLALVKSITFVAPLTSTSQKSLADYFAMRNQFVNNEMAKDSSGMNQDPKTLGFNVLASVQVTCPDSAATPCGGDVSVLSKNPVNSGNQEFYLVFTMGTGYTYYGPFTDDLQRIVTEAKATKFLSK